MTLTGDRKNGKNIEKFKRRKNQKKILESLDLLFLRIDGCDVRDKLYEKIVNVSALDPEKSRKLKDIIENSP